jgi:hypothetical protein
MDKEKSPAPAPEPLVVPRSLITDPLPVDNNASPVQSPQPVRRRRTPKSSLIPLSTLREKTKQAKAVSYLQVTHIFGAHLNNIINRCRA